MAARAARAARAALRDDALVARVVVVVVVVVGLGGASTPYTFGVAGGVTLQGSGFVILYEGCSGVLISGIFCLRS